MTRVLRVVLILLAVVATPTVAQAQTGYVTGSVSDAVTGAGVSGAQVVISTPANASAGGAVTSNDGGYRISNVPAGTYTITVRRVGYRASVPQSVTVVDGSPSLMSFELEPQSTILNTTTVIGRASCRERVLDHV